MTVLETVVIPFNYIPINGGGWIRTAEPEGTVLQTVAFSQTSLLLHKWRGTESNRRHTELQSVALPTELPSHCDNMGFIKLPNTTFVVNGGYRARTCDLLLVRQMLSQLS